VRIGFTGTRRGMTEAQRTTLEAVLAKLRATEFHHGDCIGADAEAHDVAVAMGCEIVIHPPITEAERAWKVAPRIHAPKPYLVRNRDIVRDTEMLIATPAEETELLRSGTWSTVRFARKAGRVVWVVLPSGEVRK